MPFASRIVGTLSTAEKNQRANCGGQRFTSTQYVLQIPKARVSSDSDDDAPCQQRDERTQDLQTGHGEDERQANIDGRFERDAYLRFVVRRLLNCHFRGLVMRSAGAKIPTGTLIV